MNKNKAPQDIHLLAKLLDSKFEGPFNLKFGLDSLLGLIPLWGDLLSAIASHYIILRAIKAGFSKATIARMLFNTYLDFFVGAIPIVGDIFDFFWKANSKNLHLFQEHYKSPKKVEKYSFFIMTSLLILVFVLFTGSVYLLSFLIQ